jgi:hypothetical protein
MAMDRAGIVISLLSAGFLLARGGKSAFVSKIP